MILERALPILVKVRRDAGRNIVGSYIDPEYVLHYVVAGRCVFRVWDRVYDLGAGDALTLAPRVLHAARSEPGDALTMFVAHFVLPEDETAFREGPPAVSVPPEARGQAAALCDAILSEWRRGDPSGRLAAAGYLVALLGLRARYGERQTPTFLRDLTAWRNIEKAIEKIHRDYARSDLSVARISRSAGLSVPYFCARFKRYIGLSPLQYLLRYRLDKAKECLLRERKNITEAAAKTGFLSVHNFSKTFRRVEGVSPAAWLRASREESGRLRPGPANAGRAGDHDQGT